MIETIITDQAKIIVEKNGNQEPIILLHAGIANRKMWKNEVDYLAKNYCVLNIDLPGYGESRFLENKIDYVAVIEAVIDFYGLSSMNILAASFGGKIAIDFCLLQPEKVKKMILISPAVSGWDDSSELLKYERQEESAKDLAELIKINYAFWINRDRPENEIKDGVKELVFKMLQENNIGEQNECEEIERVENSLNSLKKIGNEVLVINGAKDVSDFLSIGSHIHRDVSHSELKVIPETAHLPNLENFEMIKQYIDEFLKD